MACFTIYFLAELHRLRARAPNVRESSIGLADPRAGVADLMYTYKYYAIRCLTSMIILSNPETDVYIFRNFTIMARSDASHVTLQAWRDLMLHFYCSVLCSAVGFGCRFLLTSDGRLC